MNPYLSRQEKENLIRLIVLADELQTVIGSYTKSKIVDKKFLAGLRQSKTWTLKAIEKRLSYLTHEAIDDLLYSSAKIQFKLMPHAEAKKADAELERLQATVPMDIDDFMDWYSWLIDYTCLSCTKDDYAKCPGRTILMKYKISPVNPAAVNVCQYSYKAQ